MRTTNQTLPFLRALVAVKAVTSHQKSNNRNIFSNNRPRNVFGYFISIRGIQRNKTVNKIFKNGRRPSLKHETGDVLCFELHGIKGNRHFGE